MQSTQYDTEVQFNYWDTGWYVRGKKPLACLIDIKSPCPQEPEGRMVGTESVEHSFIFFYPEFSAAGP